MNRLLLLVLMGVVIVGCAKEKTVEDYAHEIEDIWACDTRKDPDCMKNIYHIGYRRNGTFYVWRKGDMMPSTVCEPEIRRR